MNNIVGVGKLLMTIPVGNILGEGVLWDDKTQSIWWTDIEAAEIFNYSITTQSLRTIAMPYRVGSFGLTQNAEQLIVAFDRGIALYHLKTREVQWLATPESHLTNNRFNDGRVDRQGRFWAGTMVENGPYPSSYAALYCVAHQGQCLKVCENISISNGLCWSPDGLTMYHADSPTHEIFQYDFDPNTASVSNKRSFVTTEQMIFPDGSEVDAAGYIWNAQWGGGQVVRYRPNGQVDLTLTLPVTNPTSIAIGGQNMDWLIITSAKHSLSAEQLSNEPQAGDVFIYQLVGIYGLQSHLAEISKIFT
ncbi:SMP-30/gluconolactonase/LRE family protein [Shewanella baltica]|uniref:SMP-30/gluconolactonase/LRE family protein n=1 Tax=Shewanella baltica TaxID=62322 RepID=UPI003D795D2D